MNISKSKLQMILLPQVYHRTLIVEE